MLLTSQGPQINRVSLENPLPAGTERSGTPTATSGSFSLVGNTLRWEGTLSPTGPVTIQFSLRVSTGIENGTIITNSIVVNDGNGGRLDRQATSIIGGYAYTLPLVRSR